MSRSRKKPYWGVCGESDKADKQRAHRAERKAVKSKLAVCDDELPHEKEFSDPWDYAKDGKRFVDEDWGDRK